jgi:hypothetical protein
MIEIQKPIRPRSPRFPSHSLGDALVYAKKIYDGVHKSSVDSETALRIMGFSGRNGASASALGSLRQFGLIEGMGERTRVSDLSISIFQPIDEREKIDSLRHAAVHPKIFAAIYERFGNKVPAVDEPIKAFLVREQNFSPAGAKQCIESLRTTMTFLEHETQSLPDDVASAPAEEVKAPADSSLKSESRDDGALPESATALSLPQNENATHARFPLGKECYAELTIFGAATPKSFERLKAQIELLISAMSEE